MYLDCLQSHIAVCSQPDLPSWVKMDPGFWNLISIREPQRPQIDTDGFKEVHSAVFHDVIGLEGLDETASWIIPDAGHLRAIFRFANSVAGEPLLVHCWAGMSRSTAVALALIVRALRFDGLETDALVGEAVDALVNIRPKAVPNPLVLTLALEQFLDAAEAAELTHCLLNHPILFGNRFAGASPKDESDVPPFDGDSRLIVDFFTAGGSDHMGRSLAQICAQSDDWLESTHDYIQWLFPLYVGSRYNANAPLLTDVVRHAFLDRRHPRYHQLRDGFRKAITRLLKFYGYACNLDSDDRAVVELTSLWPSRATHWLTSGNHNFKRITRILRSMTLLGHGAPALSLHQALMVAAESAPGVVAPETLEFWNDAVSPAPEP